MTQLVTTEQRTETMRGMITANESRIIGALPEFMQKQKDRFMQIIVEAALDPKILGAEPLSVLAAVVKAAQCGLPLDGVHAALVPFRENSVAKAQFIPMFQGLIVTAMRNGGVKSIWSSVVYAGDDFEEIRGSEPKLMHKPSKGANRSIDNAQYVYACAKLTSGDVVFEVLDAGQVADIKATSKAKSGPWSNKSQEAEMWRKTAVRRLAKYLPKSPDLQAALDNDDEFESYNAPREVDYEPVPAPSPENTGPKTKLSDMVPKNGAPEPTKSAEKKPEPRTVDASVVPPIRWFHEIEIVLKEPIDVWGKTKIGGKSILGELTYEEAALSKDEKIVAEVERVLSEGAAIQDRDGKVAAAYQKLAEASRLVCAAGPLPDPFAS